MKSKWQKMIQTWHKIEEDIEDSISEAYAEGYVAGRAKARERQMGEWIGIGMSNMCECSICGSKIYSETEHDLNEYHRFCGRCGAKMESEE